MEIRVTQGDIAALAVDVVVVNLFEGVAQPGGATGAVDAALGGAITAAMFLKEFAQETPWVHLDIAPTARSDKDKGAQVKGATGVGVRTFVHLALALAQEG